MPDVATARMHNEAAVRRYFSEIIDGRDLSQIEACFHPDIEIERADTLKPLVGFAALREFLQLSHYAVRRVESEILDLVATENSVCVHVRHVAQMGEWVITPLGPCNCNGAEITWKALAMFKLKDGLIIGERVVRDEISILRQLGMIGNAQ